MLVIISDLHLTDGTTGSTIGASAFREFRNRLEEMAIDASWRDNSAEHQRDPKHPKAIYRPIETFDLILMGDIFDIVRSILWTKDGCSIRPWRDKHNPNWEADMADKVDEIVTAILINNHNALTTLRELTPPRTGAPQFAPSHFGTEDDQRINYDHRDPITIPAATPQGRIAEDNPPLPVWVNIYYMIGNHDWFFVREGEAFDHIRGKVVETLGLAHSHREPFPWDVPREKPSSLSKSLLAHKVLARHGDLFDAFNYDERGGTRDATSLGDALVIELINRFPHEVNDYLEREKQENKRSIVDGLNEIANVRPLEALPAWLNHLLDGFEQHGMEQDISRAVQRIWNELVDNLLDSPYLREQDTWHAFQAVDSLQVLLKASKLSIRRAEKWLDRAQFLLDKFEESIDSYTRAAANETWIQEGRVHYVVYGHTHGQKIVPLDRRVEGDKDARYFYFNSGTWKKLHERIAFVGQKKGLPFVDFSVMCYLAFFRDGERKGRPFETWTGTLASPN